MKAKLLILGLCTVMFSSCNSQSTSEDLVTENQTKTEKTEPKTDVKVIKEYDENGNLVKYDSTFYSFYSNQDMDSVQLDSIFHDFNSTFGKLDFSGKSFFEEFYRKEGYDPGDFFRRDFFRSFEENEKFMNEMMERMDSLKNDFFNSYNESRK